MKRFVFVPAKKIQLDGIWYVMIQTHTNAALVVLQNEVSFMDIAQHWSKPYVELLAAKGLVEGIGKGEYAPNQSVTRAEFTAMLVRALGYRTEEHLTETGYTDLKSGAWYINAVAIAKELGLLDFVTSSRFEPDIPITREEMATMLVAVIKMQLWWVRAMELLVRKILRLGVVVRFV